MLNAVYQLVRPRQFEIVFKDISLDKEHVLVKPSHLSICNADQRYYQGKRSEEILRAKLPMALIHEAIGNVIYDPTGTFKVGDKVVMIPNVPVESSDVRAENYLRSSLFRGSSMDGFMQEYIETVPDRLVAIPDTITNDLVAAFTEMVSVVYHALSRFDRTAHQERETYLKSLQEAGQKETVLVEPFPSTHTPDAKYNVLKWLGKFTTMPSIYYESDTGTEPNEYESHIKKLLKLDFDFVLETEND